jgi:hypothetical protein
MITYTLIDIEQLMKLCRDSKYAVKISTHRQVSLKLIYPHQLLGVLTLVAVTIAARVVGNLLMTTLITII